MRATLWASLFILGTAAAAALGDIRPADAVAAACVAFAAASVSAGRWRAVALTAIVAAAIAALSARARDRTLSPDTGGLPLTSGALTGGSSDAPVVAVHGRLLQDAVRMPDDAIRLLIDVRRIDYQGHVAPAHVRVQAYVGGAPSAHVHEGWTTGRWIRAPMSLRAPPVLVNPGGFSERWQRLTRGYQLSGTIKSALLVDVGPGGWLDEAGARVRQLVRRAVTRASSSGRDDTATMLLAILIGDRAGLSDETVRRLQLAGTYHVVAISGGNVALVAGLTLGIVRWFVRSARLVAATAVVAILAYAAIVAGEPSVRRAVLTVLVYLAAVIGGLSPSALHVLASVAVAIVLVSPLEVLEPAAWLSYGATAGILILGSAFLRPLAPTPPRSWSASAMRAVLALVAATGAAELTLLPIAARLFGRIGLAGLGLNLVAVPAMALVQVAGAALVAFASLGLPGTGLLFDIAALGVWALTSSARLVDVAPWLVWRVAPPAWGWMSTYYLTAVCLATFWSMKAVRRPGLAAMVAAVGGVLLAPETRWAHPDNLLRLTMIDVGQGESLLVQFPSGQAMLVDTGIATPTWNVADRIVIPALWSLGVRRLDWLVVTHPDLDHIGGAATIAREMGVREIWEGVPVPRDVEWARLRDEAHRRGAPWRVVRAGDRVEIGDVVVDVLNPPTPDWERQRVRNDDSVVLRLRYGQVEWLLTGDIGADVERDLPVERSHPLRLLKVAHHGSRSSSHPSFVKAYEPVLALVSAGTGNVFGHPAPDVLARFAQAHTRLLRTDLHHVVIVETDGRVMRARTGSGVSWQARVWGEPP